LKSIITILVIYLSVLTASSAALAEVAVEQLRRGVNCYVMDANGVSQEDSYISYDLGLFDHAVSTSIRGTAYADQNNDLLVDETGLRFNGSCQIHLSSLEAGDPEVLIGAFHSWLWFIPNEASTYRLELSNVSEFPVVGIYLEDMVANEDVFRILATGDTVIEGDLEAGYPYILHLTGSRELSTTELVEEIIHFDFDFLVNEGMVAVEQMNLSQVKALFN